VYVLQNTKVHVTKSSLSGGMQYFNCVRNAPKVTYERLRFEKFFRGYSPGPPLIGEGGHEEGKEGEGGEGEAGRGRERKEGREESGAPSLQASAPALPLGWLRPCCSLNPVVNSLNM
jgi:hypothetical protein